MRAKDENFSGLPFETDNFELILIYTSYFLREFSALDCWFGLWATRALERRHWSESPTSIYEDIHDPQKEYTTEATRSGRIMTRNTVLAKIVVGLRGTVPRPKALVDLSWRSRNCSNIGHGCFNVVWNVAFRYSSLQFGIHQYHPSHIVY